MLDLRRIVNDTDAVRANRQTRPAISGMTCLELSVRRSVDLRTMRFSKCARRATGYRLLKKNLDPSQPSCGL